MLNLSCIAQTDSTAAQFDTMYGWLGAASFLLEIGAGFYQPCNTLPTVINEVFTALLVSACMGFCT